MPRAAPPSWIDLIERLVAKFGDVAEWAELVERHVPERAFSYRKEAVAVGKSPPAASRKVFPPPLVLRGRVGVGVERRLAHKTPTLTLPRSTRGGEEGACRMCHAPSRPVRYVYCRCPAKFR